MAVLFKFLLFSVQVVLVLGAACNHDNCLRAVIASNAKPYPSSASQDCVSFFKKTVTPCPSTKTITATSTETITVKAPAYPRRGVLGEEVSLDELEPRGGAPQCPTTASPSAVPQYASACSGTVRYSSACSCIGVTQQTITAPTPVVTKTVSKTVTATATQTATPPQNCKNTPNSRQCWGKYSINTNYYEEWPQTGKIVEYWLSVQEGACAPDGYKRTCMTFNGTIPGPQITADWGDTLVIHVTNNMNQNGTSIHWHGMRQLNNTEYDGVPGVTQCAIPPGQTMTYRFQATQYGSTWYHSHFTLQYAEGLLGPLVINGPTSANYDTDLGMIFLSDWSHVETFTLWNTARLGAPPSLENTLINGMNTFSCTNTADPKCIGGGKKFETFFEKGKKHKMRIINVAIEGIFQFSIDGHKLTVVAADLVPIVPFTTDSIVLHPAQRYDIIVEANATPGDYWLRGGWLTACSSNQNPDNMTGIVRYDRRSKATPSSVSTVTTASNCFDPPSSSLVPKMPYNVGTIGSLSHTDLSFTVDSYFKWTINSSSLLLDWANPTIKIIEDGKSVFPTAYNVIPVNAKSAGDWFVLVIQDTTGLGISHPIHLHGHDSWVLAQQVGTFDGTTNGFNLVNPTRRDTVTLPGGGYIALAFAVDNPGAWLVHCHIAWHASEGLSLELVESESSIPSSPGVKDWQTVGSPMCAKWASFYKTSEYKQEDSGI